MEVLKWPKTILAGVFDIDETLYQANPDYNRHQREVERAAVAKDWDCDVPTAQMRLGHKQRLLSQQLQRKPSAAEVIRSLGFSQEWLVEMRTNGWQPDRFLKPNSMTIELMNKVSEQYLLAFATTSPRVIATKVLEAIGLAHLLKQEVILLGGEDAAPKPKPDIYQLAAQQLGLSTKVCLSVGDRKDFDCVPAMSIGMGAVVVTGLDDLHEVLKKLLSIAEQRRLQ